MKCSVCFEELKDSDSRGLDYYVCSYCGSRQPKFVSEDFDKRKILSNVKEELSRGDLERANQYLNDYVSEFPKELADDYKNIKDFVDSGVIYKNINTNTYKSKLVDSDSYGTAVVLLDLNVFEKTADKIIEHYNNNSVISKSLNNIRNGLKRAKQVDDALIIVKADDTNIDIYDPKKTIVLDLDSEQLEANVLKNIKSARGLAIYCGNYELMENAYVLNLFYRFKKLNKPIVFLYSSADEIKLAYKSYQWININDKDKNNQISKALNGQSIDALLYETYRHTVVSLENGKNIIIPSYATEIKSRCAYKKNIGTIIISNKGKFTVMERAFDETTVEEFIVNEKECELIIEANAFYDEQSLKRIEILSNINTFGVGCFKDCINLSNIVIESEKCLICEHAFEKVGSIGVLTLKGNVTINKNAFKDTNIDELIISSDAVVDNKAFNNCKNVTIIGGNGNGKFSENSFPENTVIEFKGKELKDYYNNLNKKFKKNYKLEYVK
ncbi:MAG: leucine-rich repeat domain-containing protein [Acholeplasmatales bacterium]|nr:leucine-rich repeat domain-containing protein [Acholeplasmatales bacterium]